MDFNPLTILAAAALGEKDAPSDLKGSESGTKDTCEAPDSKDAEEESNEEMGKASHINLKNSPGEKDNDEMAPHKIPWSPLIPSHLESETDKNVFSLDDLVQDIKKKSNDRVMHSSQQDSENKTKVDSRQELADEFVSIQNAINKETKLNSPIGHHCQNISVLKECTELDNSKKEFEQDDSNSRSDIDTMDSVDSKSPEQTDSASEMSCSEWIYLDHTYALAPGQTHPPLLAEEDDVDVCSDHSPLTEETEQRSRNLSLDFNYLKSGILEAVSASTLDLYKMSTSGLGRSKLPSSSSSTSSPTSDLSKASNCVSGTENGELFSTNQPGVSSTPVRCTPKYGKYKIGTFASFSSSNLELEKYLRNKDLLNKRKLRIGIPAEGSSPSASPVSLALVQSPSLDWDRSEASSETQDDSSDARTPHRMSPDMTTEKVTEWSHPMYHDHDYCVKISEFSNQSDLGKQTVKRKYTKRKNKTECLNHEKIMKAKYLKKELLKQDTFIKACVQPEPLPADSSVIKTNPVGRPRKRPIEKIIEEEIDPETGTKLKITGRFQDQYVYYLSKSSRSTTRRRQTPLFPSLSDKIIVPAPKPGDIVVPHLTDADIETIRLQGRGALNLPERPQMNISHVTSAISTIPSSSHSHESFSDVDSHIVSTILSMESDNLSSPTTSHAPDISSSGLNPNQQTLTESLRLMSGDSNITSEHVLNYLLSVVKDDGLLGSGSGFDSSSSALFPSIPTDAVYSKSDHGVSHHDLSQSDSCITSSNMSHELLEMGKDLHNTFSNSQILRDHSHDSLVHTGMDKDHMDESGLPDDLSSFMSNSQETSSSSTTHDGDSHSSLKSMFGSDLSSLGTPQLSSSVSRLTSIEKTLDYLVGTRDDEMKLHCPDLNQKLDQGCELPLPSLSVSSDDTPWIVTVTLYFNDVPAIMINNQPYIRLVDIHKQILPAKDTGILKKRCQLLKIPVLNCTEMQRYFLVQYGRAYNSKSTLVISKEQANNLVTYYATPQPRVGKTEESHPRRASSGGSESGPRSPASTTSTKNLRKRGPNKIKKASVSSCVEVSGETTTQSSATEDLHANQNKRTRHKKVNYREMLKGEEREKSVAAAILETIEAVAKSGPDYVTEGRRNKLSSLKSAKGHSNCDKKKKKLVPHKIKKRDLDSKINKDKYRNGFRKMKLATSNKKSEKHEIEETSDIDSDDELSATQSKKFKPLKLKVNSLLNFAGQRKGSSPAKKGLFSRSNSCTSPTGERSVRVLAVAHQAAVSGGNDAESHLPSQPADIHLDLFTQSNSACVRCQTCSQFLSVPHFMRHHHVPMDSEWLATEAAHRILVPRNKENISESEKILWEEFHRLQEAIGGFGEADDETDTDDCDYDEDEGDDASSLELSGASSCLLSRSNEEDVLAAGTPPVCQATSSKLTQGLDTLAHGQGTQEITSHLRTSSRKRKSKQLFSIENYYTQNRTKSNDDEPADVGSAST
ncbi:uncharacterized protein LOC131956287 [Physella acuta]|uniref:uncharacterized protein LOC131956287 n=1 Tax=Physella acuta TaxID=109671 RepID=UPI0027DBEAE6|nr:uncharacterized protein LOC131956287 [Physella acuta]